MIMCVVVACVCSQNLAHQLQLDSCTDLSRKPLCRASDPCPVPRSAALLPVMSNSQACPSLAACEQRCAVNCMDAFFLQQRCVVRMLGELHLPLVTAP